MFQSDRRKYGLGTYDACAPRMALRRLQIQPSPRPRNGSNVESIPGIDSDIQRLQFNGKRGM
jgi:hypothetical protein